MQKTLRRHDLIEPELSYRIVGLLYRVSNELGPGLHEKYYQRGITEAFRTEPMPFRAQVSIPLKFENKSVGRYVADFIVADKIVVEIKRGKRVSRAHAVQLLAYLKATKLSLGILAYFGTDGVMFKRILNTPQANS